jgi:hypothetical protein
MIYLKFEDLSVEAFNEMVATLSEIVGAQYKPKWLEVDEDRARDKWLKAHIEMGRNMALWETLKEQVQYPLHPRTRSVGHYTTYGDVRGAMGRHWKVTMTEKVMLNIHQNFTSQTTRIILLEMSDHLESQALQIKLSF